MILYLIKSIICLLLLLLIYKMLLEREKMHRFNRYFLILSLIFGLTIPLIMVAVKTQPISNLQLSKRIRSLTNQQMVNGPEPSAGSDTTTSTHDAPVLSMPWYVLFVSSLYLLISLILLIRLLRNLYLLIFRILNNEQAAFQRATLVLVDGCSIPYSFLSYIFVDKRAYESGNIEKTIFTHELTHVQQKHSLDILFIEVLKIIFWFNPVIYFFKKAMQLNHEFLADESVIATMKDVPTYQKLLLRMQSGKKNLQLTSSIHYSITKKRIMMMTKKTPRLRTICKQLALIPILAGLIFLFGNHVAHAQDVKSMSLSQLVHAVYARMQSKDKLSNKEKIELKSLLAKMQNKLNQKNNVLIKPTPPPPPTPIDSSSYAEIAHKYNEQLTHYLSINPIKRNKPNLEKSYSKLSNLYGQARNAYNFLHNKNYNIAKPAPLPVGPSDRIKYNKKRSKSAHTMPPPPAPTPKNEDPSVTLKKYYKIYNKSTQAYFKIPASEENKAELEAAYKKVMAIYKAADSLQKVVHRDNPPPPPPVPLKPVDRIKQNKKQ